jgi:tetratricopeptide (TPR) repeat protein
MIIAYYFRGVAYDDKGDYDRAIADFNVAIEYDPDDADYYSGRGKAYKHKGDYDKAIADFEYALKLEPDYEDAKEGLAEARRKRDAQVLIKSS